MRDIVVDLARVTQVFLDLLSIVMVFLFAHVVLPAVFTIVIASDLVAICVILGIFILIIFAIAVFIISVVSIFLVSFLLLDHYFRAQSFQELVCLLQD